MQKNKSVEEYQNEIIKIVNNVKDSKKGELLVDIMRMLEILPLLECQRIDSYLFELFFS